MLLDENIDSELVRATIFGRYPQSRLADTIGFVNAIAGPPDASFHDEMVEQYGRVRRFLPCLLENIEFSTVPAGETALEAIRYLAAIRSIGRAGVPVALREICGNVGASGAQFFTLRNQPG